MSIREILSDIQTQIYGEDVRQSILNGLKLCYSERASGGFDPVEDANDFQNGIALLSGSTTNAPSANAFLLYSAGDSTQVCQVARDMTENVRYIRTKKNDTWSAWTEVTIGMMFELSYYNQNGTGNPLYVEQVVEGGYGHYSVEPTKAPDSMYEYYFNGWSLSRNQETGSDDARTNITANRTVYAAFGKRDRYYTVTFVDWDATSLASRQALYNHAVTPPADPTRPQDAQYTYVFSEWTSNDGSDLSAIKHDTVFYASYTGTLRSYLVRFIDHLGTVLQSSNVAYGSSPNYTGNVDDLSYVDGGLTYSWDGWALEEGATEDDSEHALASITGSRDIYVVYSSASTRYSVVFKNTDAGRSELQSIRVEHGNDAVYSGPTPVKDSDNVYHYDWTAESGWNTDVNATVPDPNALSNITAPRTVYAIYTKSYIDYVITFHNGTQTWTRSVHYGESYQWTAADGVPAKASTAEFSYSFLGWIFEGAQPSTASMTISNVTANVDVYAAFSETRRSYTVNFISNGSAYGSPQTVEYGSYPTRPADPSIQPTAQYTYTFLGWNSSQSQAEQGVIDENVFSTAITGNKTIYAVYSRTVNTYTITFVCGANQLEVHENVPYGSSVLYNDTYGTPSKDPDTDYVYTFIGWSTTEGSDTVSEAAINNVTGSAVMYPVFRQSSRDHTVWFYDYDGSPLPNSSSEYTEITVRHGNSATYGGTAPTRASDQRYSYTFVGWSTSMNATSGSMTVTNITDDTVLYAAYSTTDVPYYVYFYNGPNSDPANLYETKQTTYGGSVTKPSVNPTKTSPEYTYTFTGWALTDGESAPDPDEDVLQNVTSNRYVYAAYSREFIFYTVLFYNDDGSELLNAQETTYHGYVEYEGEMPEKDPSSTTTYVFDGWASQPNQTVKEENILNDITDDKSVYAVFREVGVIYGIKRAVKVNGSYNTSPQWERTDAAVGLTAVATNGSTMGHSDFDSAPIYRDIKREYVGADSDVMVKIPAFYFRRYVENDIEYIKISSEPYENFELHPAFRHNGTTQDYIYVGAYMTGEGYYSKPNLQPVTKISSAIHRTQAMRKGNGWGEYDYTTHSAIQMLYLIEFATNYSMDAIGMGRVSAATDTVRTTGTTDALPKQSGETAPLATLTGALDKTDQMQAVVWRGIEDIWSYLRVYVDGIVRYSTALFMTYDQSQYANFANSSTRTNITDAGYVLLKSGSANVTLVSASYYVPYAARCIEQSTDSNDLEAKSAFMLPASATGSYTTSHSATVVGTGFCSDFICPSLSSGDYCKQVTTGSNVAAFDGIFALNLSITWTGSSAKNGARLIYIPDTSSD